MTTYRLGKVAELTGASVDTVRRWVDSGKLPSVRTPGGHRLVEATALADFMSRQAGQKRVVMNRNGTRSRISHNEFPGVVTKVVRDKVTAMVEIQAGPHRVVSLLTREAADELGLVPGMLAIASVKPTNVQVDLAPG